MSCVWNADELEAVAVAVAAGGVHSGANVLLLLLLEVLFASYRAGEVNGVGSELFCGHWLLPLAKLDEWYEDDYEVYVSAGATSGCLFSNVCDNYFYTLIVAVDTAAVVLGTVAVEDKCVGVVTGNAIDGVIVNRCVALLIRLKSFCWF